ncbi:MAG: hypothetical protein M1816_003309 [Peltula sp. TS41687]|nr:MAG: hypothetical protein M1816_003309 [Peltula sp. TS41687]
MNCLSLEGIKCSLPRRIRLALSQLPGMDAELYIAMYEPVEGNYEHWALVLEHDAVTTIFQVIGQSPEFKSSVLQGINPKGTNRHRRNILVGTIDKEDVQKLPDLVKKVAVDNETSHWTCQDYVTDVLDLLREEGFIDEYDEHYEVGIGDDCTEKYKPGTAKVYPVGSKDRTMIDEEFDELHRQGRMSWSNDPTSFPFPCFVVWKTLADGTRKGGTLVDTRALNQISVPDTYSIPS